MGKGFVVAHVHVRSSSELGRVLFRWRRERGLTLEAVAHAVGISHVSLMKWEGGQRSPRIDLLVRVLIFYGETVSFGAQE